jgi:hypothetical protein
VEVSEQEILVGLLAVSVCLFNCFGDIDALKYMIESHFFIGENTWVSTRIGSVVEYLSELFRTVST